MTVFTVHLGPGGRMALVAERFSVMAMLLGPLWLARHGAWIAAALLLSAHGLVAALAPVEVAAIGAAGLAWCAGLFGHDLRRWTLELHGYRLVQLVAAADEGRAVARLLAARIELMAAAAGLAGRLEPPPLPDAVAGAAAGAGP